MYLLELNRQAFLQYSPSLNYIFQNLLVFVVLDYKLTSSFTLFRHGSLAYIMYTSNSNAGLQ